MTWRAFIIGLVFVALVSWVDPYAAFIKSYGALNSTAFPAAPVVALVVLSVGLNALLKALRRRWALRRAELMLVWCMMICAAVVPSYGIGRFLYSLIAGPAYQARRADVHWMDGGAMTNAPEELLLSKSPRSEAVRQYHEGAPEAGRIPWHLWARPLLTWGLLLLFLYLAIFFMCAILRRQWVEVERLMFPLARVPLEFSEGSAGEGWLPNLFARKAFLWGLAATAAFRLIRALPLLFGADSTMALTIPLGTVLQDTPLQNAGFTNVPFWPRAMGFAFLVPADVSLSVWFFFLFARGELAVAHRLALPSAGGDYGPLMQWQQGGAYIAFGCSLVWLGRRHLTAVLRKAVGLGGSVDDSREPVGYIVAFWGLVLSLLACVAWYWYLGMRPHAAAALLATFFISYLVYARVVAQGGLHVCRTIWTGNQWLHAVSGGHIFGATGKVIGAMQWTLLVSGGSVALAPMAMNAFRISNVFEKRKKWLVPACMAAILVALIFASHSVLRHAYGDGVLNFSDLWGQQQVPRWGFAEADSMIRRPAASVERHMGPFFFGAAAMGLLTFMRARFYWWPVHSIGLLAVAGFHAQRLWIPFLLGWMAKIGIMKLGGGRRLRQARDFFIALILVEAFTDGFSVFVSTLTGGAVPGF